MRHRSIQWILAGALVAACAVGPGGSKPDPQPPAPDPTGSGSGDSTGLPNTGSAAAGSDTFDHPDPVDPWSVLERMLEEGPPSYSAHVHSCMKMKYATLGTVLASRGVVLANTTATSGGFLYTNGAQAIGIATYAQRIAEPTELTTAGASKMLDIYASAAPEIIAAMPNRAECTVNGVATQMFDATNACTARGIECITGLPATGAQIELCSQVVVGATSLTNGKNMAVAVTMAAAQMCE
jgi:hypothetical protein